MAGGVAPTKLTKWTKGIRMALPPFKPRIPVIYGAGGIGAPGTFCKLTDAHMAQPVLDAWVMRCGPSAVDTSNLHGFGTSEKILGEMDLRGAAVDTKCVVVNSE